MQILYLFVFGCFLSECLTVTTKEIEEFESIFDVFVKLTEHKDLFFSTLTKLRNVCLCAHAQLEKINADLENGIRDAPPDVQSKAIMMQDTLKGLMSKLPREKVSCTFIYLVEMIGHSFSIV
ncbi:hypothetical protein FKM82_012237 [Ascaphus truei]